MLNYNSYCTNVYFGQIWCNFKTATMTKIKVVYNNVFRSLMKLKRDTSMSEFIVNNNVDPFIVLYRKVVSSFRNRVLNSKNEIV